MRIAIVSDYYYPSLGGITEHVHNQARSLQERGHEVTVITGRALRPPRVVDRAYSPEQHAPFEVLRLGVAVGLYGNGAQTLHTVHPLGYWKLKRLFHERQFDVVHTHAPYNPSLVQVAPFVAPKESVVVGTFHSVFPRSRRLDLTARLLRPSIDRLDGRIVVSEACIESLQPYFPGDYTVIPNGVDVGHFSPCAEALPRFADGKQNILYLGRFDPRNGLDTMIRAFTIVRRERGDSVRLIVVGDGPLKSYYRRMVPDDVAASISWVGRVNWDRPRYFASADLLCTPCERASFGMVLLEAMSSGVPVVASRISGFQLLMEDGCQGVMIPDATDHSAFARAIVRLLDSPGDRERMGCEGRRTAESRYSWGAVAERIEEYYCEIIRTRRGRTCGETRP